MAPQELVPVSPEWLHGALEEAEADGEELWVDATVLRCCNQAYELAVAHRAETVRLEHLVHAMTLIPYAAERLRASGISDATLRRESGIIIAHDIPARSHSAGMQPNVSNEMEALLRHAADRAYALRSPVTVEDILQTLFEMTRESSAHTLLSRHRADWSLREPVVSRADVGPSPYYPPQPQTGSPSTSPQQSAPQNSPQNSPVSFAWPSDRSQPTGNGASHLTATPANTLMPGTASALNLETTMSIPSVTDSYQNSRIDALERTVKDLADALRGRIYAPMPQPEPVATPRETQPVRHTGYDRQRDDAEMVRRLGDVEATVDLKFRELARTWNVLGDRLQSLEDNLLDDTKSDPATKRELERLATSVDRLRSLEGLPNRLDRIDVIVSKLDRLDRVDIAEAFEKKLGAMEGTFNRVLRRLDTMEAKLDSGVDGDFDLDPVRERLEALTRAVSDRTTTQAELQPLNQKIDALSRTVSSMGASQGTPPDMRPVTERIDRLERTFSERLAHTSAPDMRPMTERLDRLERTISERSTSGIDFGPVMDRFKEIESRVSDSNLVVEAIGDRIDAFESNVDAYRAQLAQTSTTLGTEIKAVASAVSAQSAASERLQSLVQTGFATGGGGGGVDPDMLINAVSQPMSQTIGQVRQLIEADRTEQREQFQYLVTGLKKSNDDHRNDLTEVHEAMLKLNSNQQTLAQSMDRWRLDVTGDLGVLAQRLEAVEGWSSTTQAVPANTNRIDELASKVEVVTRHLERQQAQRSGFLMWLFGTEDWWSDGWRTPEEREESALADGRVYRTDDGIIRPEDRPLRG
ncbi:MAG: hypothetical protein AAFR01_05680 [Pseudomonadota bacterium]